MATAKKIVEGGSRAAADMTAEELTAAGLRADGTPETEDVVQMASLRKDGSPDQSSGFKFINDAAGQELLKLQKESQASGRDMVREKGADALRAARSAKKTTT
jgi:hypothetical protein